MAGGSRSCTLKPKRERFASCRSWCPDRQEGRTEEIMRFEYDKEANALYIYLRGKIPEGGVARTVELEPGVYLDADGAGRILGVEFLDFADFRGFLERNGGKVDIPEHVRDLEASKLISL
jgi:uncharacterized protein YuzE